MVRFLSIDMTCVRRRHSMGTCWIVVRVSIDIGVNTTIVSSGFDAALPTCHATGVTLQNMSRYRPTFITAHPLRTHTQTSPFRLSTTTTTLPVHLGTRGNERGGESRRNTLYTYEPCFDSDPRCSPLSHPLFRGKNFDISSVCPCPAPLCLFNLLRSLLLFFGRDRDHAVTITHDVKSQKSDQPNRYVIDYSAQLGLREELRQG